MQTNPQAPPSARALQGWKYLRRLTPLLARVHEDGCARDKAGNRTLHFDQYCSLILLGLFNPLARSLRGLSQASQLKKTQEQLEMKRASLGSLSEAARVFDPDQLLPLIAELAGTLRPQAAHRRFEDARDNITFEVGEERPVSEAAQQAGGRRDAVVRLGMGAKPAARPDHTVRLVVVATAPHAKRGGRKGKTAGPASNGQLLIATNLLAVPAEIIALIYQHRWAIEIFFRFFKHGLGCRHLLSASPDGIAIQAYCALIACLLINLWTGRKPTLRTYEMLGWHIVGWASDDELLAHLEKLRTPTST